MIGYVKGKRWREAPPVSAVPLSSTEHFIIFQRTIFGVASTAATLLIQLTPSKSESEQ